MSTLTTLLWTDTLTASRSVINTNFTNLNIDKAETNAWLGQFSATTSAQLASVLTDETGTWSAVFWTTPTIDRPVFSQGAISFNAPQWFLVNGKISVTVANNDLTVAILTADWSTPSATKPVYCKIGDAIRSITSALSVTKNDWTNWFNAWSAELATLEVDYFVYLGYNATDWVVIGFSRLPFWTQYSSFSTTNTSERYCAISTITNAASTDYYENIGRFAATLSAGAWYTWTVPTFTSINLIQRPIYNTRLLTYAPTIVGYSAAPTATYYRYKVTWTWVFLKIREWTAWTSNNVSTTYTAPFTEPNLARWTTPTQLVDNNATPTTPWMAQLSTNTNVVTMYKDYNSGAWTNSGNKRIVDCDLYYEI